jgi:hypothetical protein
MAELKVYLSEELDKRFRKLAMITFGFGRGSISEAAAEAFKNWCDEHESSRTSQPARKELSGLTSDPVTRAEERPGIGSLVKEEDSRSANPVA